VKYAGPVLIVCQFQDKRYQKTGIREDQMGQRLNIGKEYCRVEELLRYAHCEHGQSHKNKEPYKQFHLEPPWFK
jgi:hypothetical protein